MRSKRNTRSSASGARDEQRAQQIAGTLTWAKADVTKSNDGAFRFGSLAALSVYHPVADDEVGPKKRALPTRVAEAVKRFRNADLVAATKHFPAGLRVDFFPSDVPAYSHLSEAHGGNPATLHPGITLMLGFHVG